MLLFVIFIIILFVSIIDKHYWTHGFSLNTSEVMDSVPLFLREFAKKIFSCGKAVNLLKACCPDVCINFLRHWKTPKNTTVSEQFQNLLANINTLVIDIKVLLTNSCMMMWYVWKRCFKFDDEHWKITSVVNSIFFNFNTSANIY
jgi:hypothetical protein